MVAVVAQERLADPAQVRLSLLVELDPRPNSRMDEQIIAEAAGIDEAPQEGDMLAGDRLFDRRQRAGIVHDRDRLRVGAIAFDALGPAEPKPAGNEFGLAAENSQQHLLVVAEDADRPDPGVAVGPQPFDHLDRSWAAVDQVAEEHEECLAFRFRSNLEM